MKIELDFAKKLVTIDGTQEEAAALLKLVKDVAPSMTEIRIVMDSVAGAPPKPGDGFEPPPPQKRNTTMRDFAKSLGPDVQAERIAVIAYYVIKIQNRDGFSPKEMSDWLGLCYGSKPQVPARAMYDAKKNRAFVEAKGHANWTITTEGENFVLGLAESKSINLG